MTHGTPSSVAPLNAIDLRRLSTPDDYMQCVQLQRETWGHDFAELVPPAMLMIAQKVGGISAGAFDRGGTMLGFVFGVSGVRDNRPAHWSHMLAVHRDHEGRGIGTMLKRLQRELLLELGVEVAYWSYDPLVARNAHINLNRLGAVVLEYVQDMYGDDTRSDLHSGLGTDRFVVRWDLRSAMVERALRGERTPSAEPTVAASVITNVIDGRPLTSDHHPYPLDQRVRVEVPQDIHAVKQNELDLAHAWRVSSRSALLHYLTNGYEVAGFERSRDTGRCFYVLGNLR